MHVIVAVTLAGSVLWPAAGAASDGKAGMEISRNGTRASAEGPAEYFTGSVRIDPLFDAVEPARASAGVVTFEPGARTAWHSTPGPNLDGRMRPSTALGWSHRGNSTR